MFSRKIKLRSSSVAGKMLKQTKGFCSSYVKLKRKESRSFGDPVT
jgi:hypothetical protein